MQQLQPTLPIGTVILSHYRVEKILGKSNSSAVYLIKDLHLRSRAGTANNSNLFILKELLTQDEQVKNRFLLEGQRLTHLAHLALPRVYRVFEDAQSKRVYMLIEYIEGAKLADVRKRQPQNRFALPHALAIMAPIVDAVSYLHRQQPPLLHRAISPTNMVVPAVGGRVMLVDMGIPMEYAANKTSSVASKPVTGYDAPEDYAGQANPQTDIYALGATFYTLLTGIAPIDALQRTARVELTGKDPLVPIQQLVPTLPPHIADAIHRALSLAPSERFPDVGDFRQSLAGYAAAPSLSEQPTVPLTPLSAFEPGFVPDTPPLLPNVPQRAVKFPLPFLLNWQSMRRLPLSRTIVALGLIILFLGLLFGVGLSWEVYTLASHNSHAITAQPSPVHHLVTTQPTTSKPTATITPTAPATSTPTIYPLISNTYYGTISDLVTNMTMNITLSQMEQNNETVHGYFSELPKSATFLAVLDTSKHIYFTIPGQPSLFFEGAVRADHKIAGDYCSIDAAGQCTQEFYGLWSVTPAQ